MTVRRLAIAAVALSAAIGLSGCGPEPEATTGGSGPAAAASAAAPAEAAAELAAAATKLTENSLKVKTSMAAGLNAEGVADKAGERMDMTMTVDDGSGGEAAMTVEMRKVGTDLYMKFDGAMGAMLGDRSDKWMHVDAAKVPENSAFNLEKNDPRSAARMIEAAARVEKTGERSFRGVLDMTKSPTADEQSLKALGAKAAAVPFTAEADAEGRLVEMVIDMGAVMAGAGKMTTTYFDFGTPVSVEAPPASQVIEMPKEMLGVVGT